MTVRIAKYIADSGIVSRRQAEELIKTGHVTVNGKTIDTPVFFIEDGDVVTLDGKKINARTDTVVYAFHKPINTVTTRDDPRGRRTIYDALPTRYRNLKYIGRLDFKTTGLLLLTNDGELARKLTLPSSNIPRVYIAHVAQNENRDLDAARRGITVDGINYSPMKIDVIGHNMLRVEIREGKKNEVRIVLDAVGAHVLKLHRVSFGAVRLDKLEPGKIRIVDKKVIDATLKYVLPS